MKTQFVVRVYLESILNEYPEINCTGLINSNKEILMKHFGYDEKAIDKMERGLRTRFYYWRKFNGTKPSNINSDIEINLVEDDIDFINSLTDERIIRLPIGSIHWDEENQTYVTDRDRECVLMGIERFKKGDFGPSVYDQDAFNELSVEAMENPDTIRSWAYVNVSPNNIALRVY